jgi:hypothetical protein
LNQRTAWLISTHEHIAESETDARFGRQQTAEGFDGVAALKGRVVPKLGGLGDEPQHGLNFSDSNGFGSTHVCKSPQAT